MKVRELIEKLERVEKIIKVSPHPNTDNVKFVIHFGDLNLDNREWEVSIDEITFNSRIGCYCDQDAVVALAIKEVKD